MYKSFLTLVALIWFLSCMSPHVHVKVTFLCKRFLTLAALIWFLSCMSSHMHVKMTLPWKSFLTLVALIWWNIKWSHLKGISPLCMITFEGLHYVFSNDKQSTLIGKTFMTLITFIRFLFIEYSLMNYRIIFIGKTLITMFTFKRLLATVCSLMDYKMSYFNKTTITLITLKRLFSTVC